MTSVFIKDRRREDRHRGKANVKTEAEIEVMQPQIKECLEMPEAG